MFYFMERKHHSWLVAQSYYLTMIAEYQESYLCKQIHVTLQGWYFFRARRGRGPINPGVGGLPPPPLSTNGQGNALRAHPVPDIADLQYDEP